MKIHTNKKYHSLVDLLKSYGSIAVAFSGGVDSTFLAKAAYDAVGKKALAITVVSEAYPPNCFQQVRELAGNIGIRLIEIHVNILDVPRFCENPPNRCYHCKKALFSIMLEEVHNNGINTLADGSNVDDNYDYRPGIRALVELNIKSPLKELNFTKEDIRTLSKELGLTTWDKQSFACLASRFPYGNEITSELLERTWKAETVLKDMGFKQYRIRNHGDCARIEVDPENITLLMDKTTREIIVNSLKSLGYNYITLDLQGYRTGSMNEVLGSGDK